MLAESDQGLVSRVPQQLDEIAADVVALHGQAAADAGVRLETDLAPVTVVGERVLLERLVTNLVQNGVRYNRRDGVVRVVVRPAAGGALLEVVNTGDPVPPGAVAGLFEPFKRLRGERIDHTGGSGLGLTIVRSIVAAHDGTVKAHAREAGEGGLRVEVEPARRRALTAVRERVTRCPGTSCSPSRWRGRRRGR
ncbi:hypothetical protein GCM10025868_01710 [Angustibacter aerolatus]|uniref:histidine kinase n=1 Tax=Angustibacter aerolatus TaxID=1162965 RepID=A0ABQ6JDR3_9ACTN|nr:ATP-binding protein [Angustibacter aerolatus]GMA84921.1 hypothetical protein GCM10025868_01710 [Angustibacter aerolatus]